MVHENYFTKSKAHASLRIMLPSFHFRKPRSQTVEKQKKWNMRQTCSTYRIFKRKVRDSNPRYHVMGIPDFESSAFDHSANLPQMRCKGSENKCKHKRRLC